MKPWDPPEDDFYPVLDGLLDLWQTTVRKPYDGIRVIGAMWSPSSQEVKDCLARSSIPQQWIDFEHDDEGFGR